MRRAKKSRYKIISPTHKDKAAPAELELLHTRALMCMRNFTHYDGGPEAVASMERLFRDYKQHPDKIKLHLKNAIQHIREQGTDQTKEAGIKEAAKVVNELARKILG